MKKQFRGAKSFLEPSVVKDEYGEIVKSGIHTYGDTIHLFIERKIIKVYLCRAMFPGILNIVRIQLV